MGMRCKGPTPPSPAANKRLQFRARVARSGPLDGSGSPDEHGYAMSLHVPLLEAQLSGFG